jgi:hypothetical protein
VNTGAGNLLHSVTYKLVVVQPLVITDFHWFRNIHLFGSIKPQSFSVNITNPVGNPTLNTVVIITGTDPTGTITFTVASVKLSIAGGQTVTIVLNQDMQSLVSGSANVVFTFSTVMKYGVTSRTVTSNLAAPGLATSGSFTVRP